MTMAERIKKQRKGHGLSQAELAERMSLSLKTIQRWEFGDRSPKADIMPKLAEVLNTTVTYLMGLEDEPEPTAKVSSSEIPNSSPAPVPQTAHESETVHTAGRLIYEWGDHNRIDWPDTPENRDALVKLIATLNNGGQAFI